MAAPSGNQNAAKDWIGRQYGWLTVIGHYGFASTGRRILWVQCICGKELLRGKDSLNPDSSCGCQKRNPGNRSRRGWSKPGLAAIRHPNTKDICWAAGLWEGEGYSSYTDGSRGRSPSLHVGVTQKDPWVLERMESLFGGSVRQRSSKQFTYTPDGRDHLRDMYDWYISGARARGFLLTIWQFLSPRRQTQILKHGNPFYETASS